MTTRDIGTLLWSDPLAWMEKMKGPQWSQVIQVEKKRYSDLVQRALKPATLQQIKKELDFADFAQQGSPFQAGPFVEVWNTGTLSLQWKWNSTDVIHHASDMTTDDDGNVWDVVDSSNGSELYTVRYWKKGELKPSWTLPGVGPFVVTIQNQCFFLRPENYLWYKYFCVVNAQTGKQEKILYEETNAQWNLSLQKAENYTAYLVRENSGLQEAFYFYDEKFKKLPEQGFFVLAGGAPNDYLVTEGRGTDKWRGVGPRLSRWIFPNFLDHGIPESIWVQKNLLVTKKQGERILWLCTSTKEPIELLRQIGKIQFNEWAIFTQAKVASFRCMGPGRFSVLCSMKTKEKESIHCHHQILPPYANVTKHISTVRNVPYILAKPLQGKITSLLVVGYGAYGLATSMNTSSWYPLLLRGWAIAFALVRGGGDDTMAWADGGRTWRREESIADFEDCISSAQNQVHVPASATAIYGRSAGGILVGSAARRQKNTSLFGALYAEVPYLDVLRTTTNPLLPLTRLEYDEFGNPRERIEDLVTLEKISPMEGIPNRGYPGLFALVRTGKNDKEVFPYESVKWILRSRGSKKTDATKILAFNQDEGHFVSGNSGRYNRAIDLAFLLTWRSGFKFQFVK
jgi:hypothetical protein